MAEWIWLNGTIMPLDDAKVSVEDRGFQFADGVYEVMRIYNGRMFAAAEHLARLQKSAGGIDLPLPIKAAELEGEIHRLMAQAPLTDGMVYLQLTRGVAPRNHIFPKSEPTLLFYTRQIPPPKQPGHTEGVKLLPVVDDRWGRCWIKSIALLPNILAKNKAVAAGYDEAVLIFNGNVTECSASNIFAVIGGKLLTHPAGAKVLPGITRASLLKIARDLGIEVEDRAWSVAEAEKAEEMFITSTTREVAWVSRWGDRVVGTACGPVTMRLHEALMGRIEALTR